MKILINTDDIDATTSISKAELADLRGHIAAMHEFQSVAEYTLDGNIISLNENYIKLTGYSLSELTGQNIGMLLDLQYRHSKENVMFWKMLNNGRSVSGIFKRIGKGCKTNWIKATYYPMLAPDGKPFKVVEYATDITEQVQLEQTLTRTFEQVHKVTLAVLTNDLSQRIPLEEKSGEFECLCNDVNSLLDSMTRIIEMISQTGTSIIAAVNKVNAASKALSQHLGNVAHLSEVDTKH